MKPVFDENGYAAAPGSLRVFYFSPEIREYTGWSDEYINIGVSMPGNSTDIEPEQELEGYVLIFNGDKWEQREDHRGMTAYAISDRKASIVDYIGDIREGFTLSIPSTQFDKWDGNKWVTDTAEQSASKVLENTQQKAALIIEATNFIAPLIDARDGGYIDDSDIPLLSAWQKYRYALTKVDPSKPVWPARPSV